MKFVLASHNKGKLREMAAILGELGIEVEALPEGAPEPEENGATFEENARIKAKAASEFTGLPAVADDSGLCVDALDGAPGIYSARYCKGTDADRNAFLLRNMEGKENRACRFVCAIACVTAEGETLTVRCCTKIAAQAASATTRCSMCRSTSARSVSLTPKSKTIFPIARKRLKS